MELPIKNYYNEKIVNILKSIGYKHRVKNYYLLREIDGYINIHYYKLNNIEYIEFHKNYYNVPFTNNTLNKKFNNYNDFIKFLENYHKLKFRNIKLKNLINQ